MEKNRKMHSEKSDRRQSTDSTSCNSPDLKPPKKGPQTINNKYRKYNLPLTKLIDSSIKKARKLSLDFNQPANSLSHTMDVARKLEKPHRNTFLLKSLDLNPKSARKSPSVRDKYKPSRFIIDPDIRNFNKKLQINRRALAQDLALLKTVKFEQLKNEDDFEPCASQTTGKSFIKQLTQDWKWRSPDCSPKDPRRVSFF